MNTLIILYLVLSLLVVLAMDLEPSYSKSNRKKFMEYYAFFCVGGLVYYSFIGWFFVCEWLLKNAW